MDINVTIFVQALQFGCVYYFLYKFLFIPACKILQEQEDFKHALYKNLEHDQQIKDTLLQDYKIKNNLFKDALLQQIPAQATEVADQSIKSDVMRYEVEHVGMSEEQIQQSEQFLVDYVSRIVKK